MKADDNRAKAKYFGDWLIQLGKNMKKEPLRYTEINIEYIPELAENTSGLYNILVGYTKLSEQIIIRLRRK